MIKLIKQKIPLEWKIQINYLLLSFKPLNKLNFNNTLKGKKIFIFLAADYGNLGDVAITYAQHKFLSKSFPDYIVTEIPISKTVEGLVFVKKNITSEDIITTVGGGNMGNLYPSIEYFRQLVISTFKNNKIISFPQTIDFDNSVNGLKSLAKTIKVYSKHENLTLIAREKKSFDFYTKNFPKNKIILTPDIVLSLNLIEPKFKREGVIICLRDDKEKKITDTQENILKNILNDEFKIINKRDTHVGGMGLSLKTKITELKRIWKDFKKVELVVTDRLHGMIFCYITGTPAIVFLNNNHKVKSSYEWISDAPHIKLIEHFDQSLIEKNIRELKSCIPTLNDNIPNKKYEILKSVIKK